MPDFINIGDYVEILVLKPIEYARGKSGYFHELYVRFLDTTNKSDAAEIAAWKLLNE